jgi:MFS family permease
MWIWYEVVGDEKSEQVYTSQTPTLSFISCLNSHLSPSPQTFFILYPRNSVAIHTGWARDGYLLRFHQSVIMSSPQRAGSISTVRTYAGLNGRPLGLLISTIATTGFLLFGYDQGVMSGIISADPFNNYFPSTKNNSVYQGFVTAIYEIGCLIGAIFILSFGDKTGRRRAVRCPSGSISVY